MARETVPQVTVPAARSSLRAASLELGLELIEKESVAPTFLLLPPGRAQAQVLVLASWHAEIHPVHPAAVEGAERLALAASLGTFLALRSAGVERPALVVTPGATHGSIVLERHLGDHRDVLQAPVAFWPRIAAGPAPRRRVFLGARGKVIVGVWGESANAYTMRDRLVADLKEEAYGPRPLDFELLRKLALKPEETDFLDETQEDPRWLEGAGEARLRRALFEPRGAVLRPPVRHPDRPQAWIAIDAAENMVPADVARRAQALAGGARVEMAEAFPWDRHNIHHPAVQAQIQTAKKLSSGADIWPMAPWVTPSGLFTRALGTPLIEWRVPLPSGASIRFPKPGELETIERELAELFLRGVGLIEKGSPETLG